MYEKHALTAFICCFSSFCLLSFSLLVLISINLPCFGPNTEQHPPRVEVGVCTDGLVRFSDLWIASLLDQKVFQHLDETFLVAAAKACIRQCSADFWFCISSHKEGDRCFAQS